MRLFCEHQDLLLGVPTFYLQANYPEHNIKEILEYFKIEMVSFKTYRARIVPIISSFVYIDQKSIFIYFYYSCRGCQKERRIAFITGNDSSKTIRVLRQTNFSQLIFFRKKSASLSCNFSKKLFILSLSSQSEDITSSYLPFNKKSFHLIVSKAGNVKVVQLLRKNMNKRNSQAELGGSLKDLVINRRKELEVIGVAIHFRIIFPLRQFIGDMDIKQVSNRASEINSQGLFGLIFHVIRGIRQASLQIQMQRQYIRSEQEDRKTGINQKSRRKTDNIRLGKSCHHSVILPALIQIFMTISLDLMVYQGFWATILNSIMGLLPIYETLFICICCIWY